MATSRQMASRPRLLTSTAPEDLDDDTDVDEDQIDDDERAATERAREARTRPRSSTSSTSATSRTHAPKSPPAAKAAPKAPPAKKPTPAKSSSTKKPAASARPSSSSGAAHDGAGVLLGFIAYALFLAYVKGGWTGVRAWLAAKFLNRTPTAGNATGIPNSNTNGNEGWILSHLGQWPHPGKGSGDFWNAIAQAQAAKAGVPMQGTP